MLDVISGAISPKAVETKKTGKKRWCDILIDAVIIGAITAIPTYVVRSGNFEIPIYTGVLAFFVQLAVERGLKK